MHGRRFPNFMYISVRTVQFNPFTDEAQTALFKDPVRTAL